MRPGPWGAAILVTLVLWAGAGLGVLAVGRLFEGMCGSTPVAESWSPTGEFRAVIQESSCGATTGFSSSVAILAADRPVTPVDGDSLVYGIDQHPDRAGLGLLWEDRYRLRIMGTTAPLRRAQVGPVRVVAGPRGTD